MRHAEALSSSSALLASFVALVVTAWISDGLQIHGADRLAAGDRDRVGRRGSLAGILLPTLVFKRWMAERPGR